MLWRSRQLCVLLFVFVYAVSIAWLSWNYTDESQQTDQQLKKLLNKINSQQEKSRLLRDVLVNIRRRHPELIGDITDVGGDKQLPTIYAVTPTYTRPEQKAELTRISQTFNQVKKFHWIVVEDAPNRTELVGNLLRRGGINFTHLNCKSSEQLPPENPPQGWKPSRGFEQRNIAIDWLLENYIHSDESTAQVVYFADDDNTYDVRIFEEMRYTRRVSVWPVGLVGARMYERPRLDAQGRVAGWYVGWGGDRPFALDMAGFAINLDVFKAVPSARFSLESTSGYTESDLVSKLLIKMEDLEPKADNCTKVYVWHTKTQPTKLSYKTEKTDVKIEV